jgi:hypothetical protein
LPMPQVSPLLLTFSSIQFSSALINTDQVSPLFKTFDTTRVRVATPYALGPFRFFVSQTVESAIDRSLNDGVAQPLSD